MLPFTREELQLAIDEKRVYARRHPALPLTIYNYSDEVAFGGWWNNVTLNCRGLILDDDFNIVARPWAKFFNMGQRDNEIEFHAPVEVTDKLDGSLGILYPTDDGWAIATRGSFASDQAIHATEVLNTKHADWLKLESGINGPDNISGWLREWTWLFEIVYPSNRIVVNYGDMDDLVLLGGVHKQYNFYEGPRIAAAGLGWDGPVAEVFNFKDFADVLANWPHRDGKEGVVVRSGNKMIKLKQPDYLELHKLVTNATPKNVWSQLKEGHSGFAIVSNFPDEFHDYIWDMVQPLEKAYDARLDEILKGYAYMMDTYASYGEGPFDRGRFARLIRNSPDKRYYFLLLDNKPLRTVLWSELRPREATYHVESETQGSKTNPS